MALATPVNHIHLHAFYVDEEVYARPFEQVDRRHAQRADAQDEVNLVSDEFIVRIRPELRATVRGTPLSVRHAVDHSCLY
jgi:hypothetical protein